MTSMNDLPNELLDEIFAYFNPMRKVIPPIHSVCRAWNRPLTTRKLTIERIPKGLDLQLTFPRLASLELGMHRNYKHDLMGFQGHATLEQIKLYYPMTLVPLLNCPRLTKLILYIDLQLLFKGKHLDWIVSICDTLVELDIHAGRTILKEYEPSGFNQKVSSMLQQRSDNYRGMSKLKSLSIHIEIIDILPFITVFQAPNVEHLELPSFTFQSSNELRIFFTLFPNVDSLIVSHLSALQNHIAQDCIKKLAIRNLRATQVLNLSAIISQFPNLESLDAFQNIRVTSDWTSPTRISILHISSSIQPILFPHLKELELMDDIHTWNTINPIMRDLDIYCPQLVKFYLNATDSWGRDAIVPEFDNITFPMLTTFRFSGSYDFNASFCEFIKRHEKLEYLECRNRFDCLDQHWNEFSGIFWPCLASLKVATRADLCVPDLSWFLSKAPNLAHVDYANWDNKGGHEGHISRYCPNLKTFQYCGFVSSEILKDWTRVGSWSRSLVQLDLKIQLNPVDFVLLCQFVCSLSRVECIMISFKYDTYDVNYPKNDILESCPAEFKSVTIEYCKLVDLYSSRKPSTEQESLLKSALRACLPNPRADFQVLFNVDL